MPRWAHGNIVKKNKYFWIARDKKEYKFTSSSYGIFNSKPFLDGNVWRGGAGEDGLRYSVISKLGVKLKLGQRKKFRLVEVKK